jgi:porphobilinogen synthase
MPDSSSTVPFPTASLARPRRLRANALRALVRETTVTAADLIYPMFVVDGENVEREIEPMPGQFQRSVDRIGADIDAVRRAGIPGVLLFGIPATKDEVGSGAWLDSGPVPRAIRAIRERAPELTIVADVCLCEYTSHGHCGVLDAEAGTVVNDATLPLLARAAVAYADAGADVVAPSAMMDGQVAAIRRALDDAGHGDVAIMAYSVKYASVFYGPFRIAAESAPQMGDRRTYQMDPGNAREALREAELDLAEGADMVMVKPAGPYLDVIRAVRDAVHVPLVAYQVSGEYAMIKAAAERGWLDERRAVMESVTAIKRAGADIILTYYAKEIAAWAAEDR